MNNFEQPKSNTPFPSNIEKLALFIAVIPFIFYKWDALSVVQENTGGIFNLYVLIGGIAAISLVPIIFLLEFRKLPQKERVKHLMLIMAIDTVAIIHILYGVGIFNT